VNIPKQSAVARPEIIVDCNVDDGLLTVSLKNVGGSSAYRVNASFYKRFNGHAANTVLKCSVSRSRDVSNWRRRTVIDTVVGRKSVTFVMLADDQNPVGRFRFRNGWVSKRERPVLYPKSSAVTS